MGVNLKDGQRVDGDLEVAELVKLCKLRDPGKGLGGNGWAALIMNVLADTEGLYPNPLSFQLDSRSSSEVVQVAKSVEGKGQLLLVTSKLFPMSLTYLKTRSPLAEYCLSKGLAIRNRESHFGDQTITQLRFVHSRRNGRRH